MKNISKHSISLLAVALFVQLPNILLGASKSDSVTDKVLDWMGSNVILVLGALVLLGAFATIWNMMASVMEVQKKMIAKSKGIELKTEVKAPSKSIFTILSEKAWNLIPMDKEADIDLGHDYDGIRELDNSLPPWWLYLFYGTIIFGLGYLYVYHMSDVGLTQSQEYEVAMKEAEIQKRDYLLTQPDVVDETNVVMVTDPGVLESAKAIYMANCVACHGAEGQGGVGPNMTDNYYIHGGGIQDIFKTIKYGVPEKGMIAWNTQLKPSTIQNLASYIMTLVGTNPPNPKEKQGTLYISEDKVLQADVEGSGK